MKIDEQRAILQHRIAFHTKLARPKDNIALLKLNDVTLTGGSDNEILETLISHNKDEITVPFDKLELENLQFMTKNNGPLYEWLIALTYPFENWKHNKLHSYAWNSETGQVVKLEL